MRHSWAEISRNVAICRQCGMKRIREKQAGPWRSSIPNFRYEYPGKMIVGEMESEGLATFTRRDAGKCETIWPEAWEPKSRATFFIKPDQEVLF